MQCGKTSRIPDVQKWPCQSSNIFLLLSHAWPSGKKKKIWSNILLVDKYFHKLRIKETIEFCLMEIDKTNSKIEPNIFGIILSNQNPNLVDTSSKTRLIKIPLQRSKSISYINPSTSAAFYFFIWFLQYLNNLYLTSFSFRRKNLITEILRIKEITWTKFSLIFFSDSLREEYAKGGVYLQGARNLSLLKKQL